MYCLSLIPSILLQFVLAFPTSAHPTPRFRNTTCIPGRKLNTFGILRHDRTISNATTISVATVVVEVETLHVALPSTTATLTELVVLRTELPTSITVSSVQHSSTNSATTISTTAVSTTLPLTQTNISPSLPVSSGLSSPSSATHVSNLNAGSLIAVAIAGSVGINIIAFILWLCFRRSCLLQVKGTESDPVYAPEKGHDVGPQEDTQEKPKENIQRDSVNLGVVSPDLPRSPQALSIQQRFPFFSSTFWSSASSWSLDHARAREVDTPRRFTTFGLNTPLDPSPPGESSGSLVDGPRVNPNMNEVPPSSDDNQVGRALTVPSFRRSGEESTADPRSPRRHSIPLFMENYTSPSLTNHLPPESQSTIIMESGRGSYSVRASSLMHGVESQAEPEGEDDGDQTMSRHVTTSMISLPSVSSGVMTPRRHWTFVDVHGPSAAPASPQDPSSIIDRLSATESSRTIAHHGHSTTPDFFTSAMSSGALLSELPTAPSMFPSEKPSSASSGFTQYRSAQSVDDTLRDRRNI